jgi:hypothetical protein
MLSEKRARSSAPDYESGGQEFESLRARHFVTDLRFGRFNAKTVPFDTMRPAFFYTRRVLHRRDGVPRLFLVARSTWPSFCQREKTGDE